MTRDQVAILACAAAAEASVIALIFGALSLFWACECVAATCLVSGIWCARIKLNVTHGQLVESEMAAARAQVSVGRTLIGLGCLMNLASVWAALR